MYTPEPTESIFDEKYEILGQLGAGGLGTVYRAKQIEFGRTVALKVLHNQFAIDDDFKSRFLREAKVLNQLKHPNIVQIFHLGIAATGQPYLAMELIEGKSCRNLLNEQDRLPTLLALKIVRDAALALNYVHENGIVHRDLKPENILVLNEPEPNTVKLIDFGLVRLLDTSERNQKLTQTGDLLGTAAYMSPEQCKGQKADSRADIYSLGVCLFELLTGEKCYTADTDVGLLYKHATEAAPTVKASMVEVFVPSLDKLISKSMQKDPAMRFQSMQEMANAVDAVMVEVEQRISTRPAFAFAGKIPMLVFFGLKEYNSQKDKELSRSSSLKRKELAPAETVHLPMKGERLNELVFKYKQYKGTEVAIIIAKRWLKLHEKDAAPEDKLAAYVLLANMSAEMQHDEEMEYFANKVFAYPEALLQIIAVTQSMAKCYTTENQSKKALDLIEKTLNGYPTFKQNPPHSLLNLKSSILVDRGEYDKAIKTLSPLESAAMAKDLFGNIDSLTWRLNLMNAYNKTNQEGKLKKLIAKTIEVVEKENEGSSATLANTYVHIANTLKDPSGDNKDSLYYAKLSIPLFQQCKDYEHARMAKDLIGNILLMQGKYTDALAVFQDIAKDPAMSSEVKAVNFFHLYECSEHLTDAKQTQFYLEESIRCLKEDYKKSAGSSIRTQSNIYGVCISHLVDYYIERGLYPQADRFIKEWMSIALENKMEAHSYEMLCEKACKILFKKGDYKESLQCVEDALKLLNDPSTQKQMLPETRLLCILRMHMLKDIALSALNDTEGSKSETSWILHCIGTNTQIPAEAKANICINLAYEYFAYGKKSQADICAGEAEKILRNSAPLRDPDLIETNLSVAEIMSSRGRISEAEPLFHDCISALVAIKKKESLLMFRALLGLGIDLQRQRKFVEAESAIIEALKLAKQFNTRPDLYYSAHKVLWDIYFNTSKFQKAKQEAILILDGRSDNCQSLGYCLKAEACSKLREFPEAEQSLLSALKISKKNGSIGEEIFIENSFSQLYLDQKMWTKAVEHADKAIEICKVAATGFNMSDLASAYHKKGSALSNMKRKAEATQCLIQSREIFSSLSYDYPAEFKDIDTLMQKLSKLDDEVSH